MSDIFIGCNPNEKQKHNLTFGEWVDSKLQKGEFDTPLLQKIAELQSALTTAQEENKALRAKVERAFYDGIQRAMTVEIKGGTTGWLESAKEYAQSALNGGKNVS